MTLHRMHYVMLCHIAQYCVALRNAALRDRTLPCVGTQRNVCVMLRCVVLQCISLRRSVMSHRASLCNVTLRYSHKLQYLS